MDEKNLQQAKNTFATLCKMMDSRGWHYEKDEEKLIIAGGACGDDLPMDFRVLVDAERMLVSLHSTLPFKMAKDKIIDGALAISKINYALMDGSFDYDISDGSILFRLTCSFRESLLGEALFAYMVDLSLAIIDEYNDKLLMISKGMLTVDTFSQSF